MKVVKWIEMQERTLAVKVVAVIDLKDAAFYFIFRVKQKVGPGVLASRLNPI